MSIDKKYRLKFYTVKLRNVSEKSNGFILQDCGNDIAVIWHKIARWLRYFFFSKNEQKRSKLIKVTKIMYEKIPL